MTTLVLLVLALLLFAGGYRYFAKLLAVTAFRPLGGEPRPAQQRSGWLASGFAHGATAAVGALTVPGVVIAVAWGWAPAYQWILGGSLLAGGVLGLGYAWLRDLHPRRNARLALRMALGPPAASATEWTTAVLLLLVAPLAALTLGAVIVRYPAVVWPLLLQAPLAVLVARILARGRRPLAVVSGFAAIAVAAASLLLEAAVPVWGGLIDRLLAASGGGGPSYLAVGVVCMTGAWLAAGSSALRARRMRFESVIALAPLAFVLGAALLALVIVRPEMAAPEFAGAADIPPAMPLVMLTVIGGAVTVVATLSRAEAAPALDVRERIRYGYGSALLPGLVALAMLLVLGADLSPLGLAPVAVRWLAPLDMGAVVAAAVERLAALATVVYLPAELGRGLGAWAVAAPLLVCLDLSLATLGRLVDPGQAPFAGRPALIRAAPWLPLLVAVLVLIYLGASGPAPRTWALAGLANLVAGGALLLGIAVALLRLRRATAFVLLPALALLAAAAWGAALLVGAWAGAGRWPESLAAAVSALLAIRLLRATAQVWRAHRRQRLAGDAGQS